jgi:hypothetical protein
MIRFQYRHIFTHTTLLLREQRIQLKGIKWKSCLFTDIKISKIGGSESFLSSIFVSLVFWVQEKKQLNDALFHDHYHLRYAATYMKAFLFLLVFFRWYYT